MSSQRHPRLIKRQQEQLRAAQIYRHMRKKGITNAKTNDCLIAATVLEHRCQLLHHDKDFSLIERHFPLRVRH